MSSAFVTTHLVVGDPPSKISGRTSQVQSTEQAIEVIERGGTAVLPDGAWDLAADVLRYFGADEEHIRFQVDTARDPSSGGEIPDAPGAIR